MTNFIHSKNHLPYHPGSIKKARALRHNMTDAERKLWFCFLRKHPGRFMRQKMIDRYIVDFYSAALKLVIEIDGESHFNPESRSYELLEAIANYF